MLTPSIKDPNRDAQLKRREEDPKSFGAAHEAEAAQALANKLAEAEVKTKK